MNVSKCGSACVILSIEMSVYNAWLPLKKIYFIYYFLVFAVTESDISLNPGYQNSAVHI